MEENSKTNLATPIAVVIAGLLIAGAVLYGNPDRVDNDNSSENPSSSTLAENLEPVTEDDHLRGNPDADLIVIEYSDLECPFCKMFHYTMAEVLEKRDEEIAWVFRHFPLASLHAKAETEAIAAECAAEIAGEDAFWSFIDRVFNITPSNDGLDLATLPDIAEFAGVNRAQFETCLENKTTLNKVTADYENAVDIGADGTPYVIIIDTDGTPYAIFREDVTNASEEAQELTDQIFQIYERNIQEARG